MTLDAIGVNARLKEFDARHGGKYVVAGGWLLFADGARREENPMGALVEPPENAYERAKLTLRFHETRLKTIMQKFDTAKQQLLAHCDANRRAGYSAPDACHFEELQKIHARAVEVRTDYEAAKKAFEDATPAHIRDAPRLRAEAEARVDEYAAKVRDLKL